MKQWKKQRKVFTIKTRNRPLDIGSGVFLVSGISDKMDAGKVES